VTTEPLALKGVPKPRVCKDCAPRPKPLPAPYVGPRCHAHHHAHRKATKARNADAKAMSRYGMPAWFRARLWALQGRTCAICARAKGITRACSIDHDHKKPDGSASWRGLICGRCNTFLGYVRDDPEVGRRLARYLDDPPAQQLLREIEREGGELP
jgi:hypothetical protein